MIFACCAFGARQYSEHLKKSLGQTRGFLRLLGFMRGRVSTYLDPVSRWCEDFSDEWLEKCGFVSSLRSGRTLRDAYREVEDKLSLPSDARELLDNFFSRTGLGYLDAEIKNIDYTAERLERLCENMQTGLKSRTRVVKTSLYALALGIAVLVM